MRMELQELRRRYVAIGGDLMEMTTGIEDLGREFEPAQASLEDL